MTDLLRVHDLNVRLPRPDGSSAHLLQGVHLRLDAGEAVGLVGPSGCGKSLAAHALCGLLPPGSVTGEVSWRGRTFPADDPRAWSEVRGAGVTLVQQHPGSSLNPVLRVGEQVAETVRRHAGLDRAAARRRAVELLREVRIPDPAACAEAWPHQLSGGLQQRALLAAALACGPRLLVADEPTTALDPTVQASILRLLDDLRRQRGMALLLISHDPSLVDLLTDRSVHLDAGRIVAAPPPAPVVDGGAAPMPGRPGVLAGEELSVTYPGAARPAVRGVDIRLDGGGILGLAGESGCGKTTLARLLSGHLRPGAGRVLLDGADLHGSGGPEFRRRRRQVQLLFQQAGGSLDPRQRAGAALREAGAAADQVATLLAEVDLPAAVADRLPHQLSGGQRQRLGLARCLAAGPRVLVADEPASALDPRAAARVRTLLVDAVRRRGLALMLISHDLPALTDIADRVMIMLGGVVVEDMPTGKGEPRHPYTRELVAAAPSRLAADPAGWRRIATGGPGATSAAAEACPHHAGCDLAKPSCQRGLPDLLEVAPDWFLRCPEVGETHQPQFIDTL